MLSTAAMTGISGVEGEWLVFPFGAKITGNGGYTLSVYSQPYVEIKAKGSGCDPRPGTITIKITSKLTGTPLVFHIPVRPLKVKFDRLVQALTCPDFHLDDLKKEVKRSVLAAALGSDDPCSLRNNIGGEKGASNTVGNYYWTVTDNTFCAKSNSDATDCAFQIKFEGEEPAVWVEDAEEWKSRLTKKCEATTYGGEIPTAIPTCQVDCSPIKEILPDAKEYTEYLLNVKVYGEECEGLQGYGDKTQALQKKLGSRGLPAYTLACVGTSIVTKWIPGCQFGIGALLQCGVAPVITYVGFTSDLLKSSSRYTFGIPMLIGAAPAIGYSAVEYWRGAKNLEEIANQLSNISDSRKKAENLKKNADVLKDALKKLLKSNVLDKDTKKTADDLLKLLENGEDVDPEKITELSKNLKKENIELKGSLKSAVGCDVLPTFVGTVAANLAMGTWWSITDVVNIKIDNVDPAVAVRVSKIIHGKPTISVTAAG